MKTAAALLVLSIFSTVSNAGDFLGDQVDALMVLMENHGPDAVIEHIEEFEPVQRLQLYELAHGYLGLAMQICGEDDGSQFENAIQAFQEGVEYPEWGGR